MFPGAPEVLSWVWSFFLVSRDGFRPSIVEADVWLLVRVPWWP